MGLVIGNHPCNLNNITITSASQRRASNGTNNLRLDAQQTLIRNTGQDQTRVIPLDLFKTSHSLIAINHQNPSIAANEQTRTSNKISNFINKFFKN